MIHRIRIQNFKSLRDVTVDLSPVTVLVGKSGTGKSNFVSAIKFFRELLIYEQLPSFHDWPLLRCATNQNDSTEFEVEFDIPGFEDRFEYRLRLHPQNIQMPPLHEELRYAGRSLFGQQSGKGNALGGLQSGQPNWTVEPALLTVPQAGPLALRRLHGIDEIGVAYTALTSGIGVYNFPFNVLGNTGHTGGNVAQWNGSSGLDEQGQNFLPVLKDISTNLQQITNRKAIFAALRQINPTVALVDLDSIQTPQKAYVGHKLGEKTLVLELRQESDGFRRFFSHLLALYQMPPKQTLVFEEPENGIYIGALSVLAEEFKTAPDVGRGQVILTTHSPALLDYFSADEIRVVEIVDLETKIGPLAAEQKEALAEELLHPGELLTVDPARREAVAE